MVKLIDIKDEIEWLNYRGSKGVGASEIPTLLGMNPYQSALELFHYKVGFNNPKPFYNLRAAYGKCSEQLNSDLVAAYDVNNPDDLAMNLKKGIKLRQVKKLPDYAFITNSDYPNIYVSPDREIWQNNYSGSLECKDTSSMVINAYVDKIVPAHIIQLKTQIMVWQKNFGLLSYILDGGRDYKEHWFERDGIIFNDVKNNRVITETDLAEAVEDFWQRVVLAREASNKKRQAMLDFQMDKAEQYQAIIDSCEPPPDESNAYEAYLRDGAYSLARNLVEIQGNAEHQLIAEQYLLAKEEMDKKKDAFQLEKNRVLNLCKAGSKIILPGKGLIEVSTTKVGIKVTVKV